MGKHDKRSRHNQGVGIMAQSVHRRFFVDTGGFQCLAKSALNAALADRPCGVGHIFAATAGRGE